MKSLRTFAIAGLLLAGPAAADPQHAPFSTPGWYVVVELLDEYGDVDYSDLEAGPYHDRADCEAHMQPSDEDDRRHCEFRDKGLDG